MENEGKKKRGRPAGRKTELDPKFRVKRHPHNYSEFRINVDRISVEQLEKCTEEIQLLYKMILRGRKTAKVTEILAFSQQFREALNTTPEGVRARITKQRTISIINSMTAEEKKAAVEKKKKQEFAAVVRRIALANKGEIIHYTFLGVRDKSKLVKKDMNNKFACLENGKKISFSNITKISKKE